MRANEEAHQLAAKLGFPVMVKAAMGAGVRTHYDGSSKDLHRRSGRAQSSGDSWCMRATMKKIVLALSGGGFRASLYHLGLVRFLRDANILAQVTHITSVSGGSIMAAYLVLNWDRFNGSPNEFDAAASEFLSFVRLDVRNRITRRFPLIIPLRWSRRLLGLSNRKLTRTGLLEYHYEKYLYGDTSLFELPDKPQLHLLSTNLSEGCLCSFNRDGLLMVRRQAENAFRIDRIHVGLATVAMAVTASSAFPGFFAPLELTGADVGASAGEFGRQAYTDGGVFDNLGVRMFRCLERPLLVDSPLSREDFFDLEEVVEVLREAGNSSAETPLRRLAQVLLAAYSRRDPLLLTNVGTSSNVPAPSAGASTGNREDLLVSNLWDVMRHYPFHREPLFAGLKPVDADAEALFQASRLGGQVLDVGDQFWLNRHLLEAAFRQATGHACFHRLNSGLDGVLVSDVGKRIEVQGNRRAGGLIRTALRATDILMDRVWQLETETFQDTPGFVFAPITEVVEAAEDPTALHPEIQRQVANIRTDIDRFSLLEISSLVRHGYGVGRKACRARPDLFGADLPGNVPWDPIAGSRGAAPSAPVGTRLDGSAREPAAVTVEARTLQASALRRIWSTLLDYRDWVSYLYVPLLVPVLALLPYLVVKSYQRSQRMNQLVESLAQGSHDFEIMSNLLETPIKPWDGEAAEEVVKLDKPDYTGFTILQDTRIIDMRAWNPEASGKGKASSLVYGYRRVRIRKKRDNDNINFFRFSLLPTWPTAQVRFPPQQLEQKLRMSVVESAVPGEKKTHWQTSADFHNVPPGEIVDLVYEQYSPGEFLQHSGNSTTISFVCQADTAEMTRWFLLPEGKEYWNWRIFRHEAGTPEKVVAVNPASEYLAEDFTIFSYKLMAVRTGDTHEIIWYYK
ncbi:MAG: patatin-like phospholipase family protein [Gemmataceae bacterium]